MSTNRIPPLAGVYYVLPNFSTIPNWLPQLSLSSVTDLYDTAAHTWLTQTFINPSNVAPIASAKYNFPLYESCAVVSFRCTIGTRIIEGIVKEKEEARSEFRGAIERQEPASLLEQHAPDVFSTTLGSIAPNQIVKIEIEYIMELKHDAEVDGLRFTIPTSIAPRYGIMPSTYSPIPSPDVKGIDISINVTMPSNIQSVQSPSHPIAMYLGAHTTVIPESAFNPKLALATLRRTSTQLDRDFVILVKCADLSTPTALLETHSTIPNSSALMVTLVPKFRLPEGLKPEVVFIVDRSGSMTSRVAPLKSSLSVFLKSLPLDINFNICSFGSGYSFLWPKSRPYSDQTLEEAQRHVNGMNADFGGTEILPPITATISNRLNNLMLEIMVLTDGQVWDSKPLFEYVERETAKGDVRLFSLGIGMDVSHSLVDGLARVGRGFSQVIVDEREGMESKVARMLRGALSAHVNNYRLEWEGKPDEEESIAERVTAPILQSVRRISLFDTNADADASVSFTELRNFVVPNVLQAPYKLQPLFPFSRSTAYVIFSDSARLPSQVWLRGTTPSGVELELEIAVHTLPQKGKTIHQLAARKILQELEDGVGYLHSGKYGISKESRPATFEKWVKQEGVRVGSKYGLASKWTSFLAVMQSREDTTTTRERSPTGTASRAEESDEDAFEMIDDDDEPWTEVPRPSLPGPSTTGDRFGQHGGSMPVMMAFLPPAPSIDYPTKSSRYSKLSSRSEKSGVGSRWNSSLKYPFPPSDKKDDMSFFDSSLSKPSKKYSMYGTVSPQCSPPRSPKKDPSTPSPPEPFIRPELGTESWDPFLDDDLTYLTSPRFKKDDKSGYKSKADSSMDSSGLRFPAWKSSERPQVAQDLPPDYSISYSPAKVLPASRLTSETSVESLSLRAKALIGLQTFDGCFFLSPELVRQLGVSMVDVESALGRFVPSDAWLNMDTRRNLWATILAIRLFESKLQAERSVWVLVVDKARAWIRSWKTVNETDILALEKLAGEVLGV